ncbi:MAG: fructosamine kinase family protein [Myxococcota bacterium]
MTRGRARSPGDPTGTALETIADQLGVVLVSASAIGGGDVGDSRRLDLAGGERLFVKRQTGGPPEWPRAEARGLAWLAEAGALRIPEVVGVGEDWLALEWIEPGGPGRDFDRRLGEGLASLHAAGAPGFGLDHDNFVGPLPQSNRPAPDWPRFYAAERIEPLRRRARDAGLLTRALDVRLERLLERLPGLTGRDGPPARLHGDLWQGNVLVDATGAPCLIDPAVYGGHREIDLAMMRLFGGFSAGVFTCYTESCPLADDADQRIALHQVYPLLVHVCLFGRAYHGRLAEAVETALEARGHARRP